MPAGSVGMPENKKGSIKKKTLEKMQYSNTICIVSIVFVSFSIIFLVWDRLQSKEVTFFHVETYKAIIKKCIVNSIQASKITDPVYALCCVADATATINTLSKLQGGDKVLGDLCGLDIANILNVLSFQDDAIRKNIPQWMKQQSNFDESHPLSL